MNEYNEFKQIEEATKLFELQVTENFARGLLYPTGKPWSYGRAALAVYARVSPQGGDSKAWEFFACIRSIDDSGVSIFGPSEEREKAKKRFDKFVEFLKSLEYRCPTPEELREYCKTAGIQEDYW